MCRFFSIGTSRFSQQVFGAPCEHDYCIKNKARMQGFFE